MNKLWVFGCSFSTSFNLHFVENYEKLNWPALLADKLNLELVNLAHAGQCNWVNILHFIDVRDEIKSDDIVIFEFTFFDRYNIYPIRAQLADLEAFFIRSEISLDNAVKNYMGINYRWFNKQILEYSKKNNLNIYYWSAEGNTSVEFTKYHKLVPFIPAPNDNEDKKHFSIYNLWQNQIEEQWILLPDGSKDKHFNQIGHQRLANHFENCIKNNLVYNYDKMI